MSALGNIRAGSTTVTLNAEAYKTIPIVFDTPMKDSNYSVTANTEGGDSTYRFFISISGKSTTGFNLHVFNDNSTAISASNRPINWIAVPYTQ